VSNQPIRHHSCFAVPCRRDASKRREGSDNTAAYRGSVADSQGNWREVRRPIRSSGRLQTGM
ncbi:hypothetical protein LTR17_027774, partial [Elasticomyces elasticus]